MFWVIRLLKDEVIAKKVPLSYVLILYQHQQKLGSITGWDTFCRLLLRPPVSKFKIFIIWRKYSKGLCEAAFFLVIPAMRSLCHQKKLIEVLAKLKTPHGELGLYKSRGKSNWSILNKNNFFFSRTLITEYRKTSSYKKCGLTSCRCRTESSPLVPWKELNLSKI